jgi:hypothetical protein
MRQQVPVLVNRAALHRRALPDGGNRLVEPRRGIDDGTWTVAGRPAEIKESAATLCELGLDPLMVEATVKRQREMGATSKYGAVRESLNAGRASDAGGDRKGEERAGLSGASHRYPVRSHRYRQSGTTMPISIPFQNEIGLYCRSPKVNKLIP